MRETAPEPCPNDLSRFWYPLGRIVGIGILCVLLTAPATALAVEKASREVPAPGQPPTLSALAPRSAFSQSHSTEVLIALMVKETRETLLEARRQHKNIHETYEMIMSRLRGDAFPIVDVNVAWSRSTDRYNLQFVLPNMSVTVGYNPHSDTYFQITEAVFEYYWKEKDYPRGFKESPLMELYEGVQVNASLAQVLQSGYREIVRMMANGADQPTAVRQWLINYGIELSLIDGMNSIAIADAVNTAAAHLNDLTFVHVPTLREDAYRVFRTGADGVPQRIASVIHGEIIKAPLPEGKRLAPEADYGLSSKGLLTEDGRTKINPDLHDSSLEALATWYQLLALVHFAENLLFNRNVVEEHIQNVIADPAWPGVEKLWLSMMPDAAAQREWEQATPHQKVAQVVALMSWQYILERAEHDIDSRFGKRQLAPEERREWRELKKLPGLGGKKRVLPESLRRRISMVQPFADAASGCDSLMWLFQASTIQKSLFRHASEKDISHVLGTIPIRMGEYPRLATDLNEKKGFQRLGRVMNFSGLGLAGIKEHGREVAVFGHAQRTRWLSVYAAMCMQKDFSTAEFLALTCDYAALPCGAFAAGGALGRELEKAGYEQRQHTVRLLAQDGIDLSPALELDVLHFDIETEAMISDEAKIAISAEIIVRVLDNILLGLKYGLIDFGAIDPPIRRVLGLNQLIDWRDDYHVQESIKKLMGRLYGDFEGTHKDLAQRCLLRFIHPDPDKPIASADTLFREAQSLWGVFCQQMMVPRIMSESHTPEAIADANNRIMMFYEQFCEQYRAAHPDPNDEAAETLYAAQQMAKLTDDDILRVNENDSPETVKVILSENFRRLGRVLGFTGLGPGFSREYASELAVAGHDRRVAQITGSVAKLCGLDSKLAKFIALTHDYAALPCRHFTALGEVGKRLHAAGADTKERIVKSLRRDGYELSPSTVNDILNFDITIAPPIPISDEAKVALACETIEGVVEDILFGIRHKMFGFGDMHGDVIKILKLDEQFKLEKRWSDADFPKYEKRIRQSDRDGFDNLVYEIVERVIGDAKWRAGLDEFLAQALEIKNLCRQELIVPYVFRVSNTPEAVEAVNRLILPHFERFCEEYRAAHPDAPSDERAEALYAADQLAKMTDDEVFGPTAIMTPSFDNVPESPQLQALMSERFMEEGYGVLRDPQGQTVQGRKITKRNEGKIQGFVAHVLENNVQEQYRAGIKEKLRVIALADFPLAGHHGMGGAELEHAIPTGYLDWDVFNSWVQAKSKKEREVAAENFAVWLEHEYRERVLGESHEELAKDPRYGKCLQAMQAILKGKVGKMLTAGLRYINAGQRDKGSFLFMRAHALDPENLEAICWVLRMRLFPFARPNESAWPEEMSELTAQALKLAPNNPAVMEIAAEVYRIQRQPGKAFDMVRPVLEKNKKNILALRTLREIYHDAGNIAATLSVCGAMLPLTDTKSDRHGCLSDMAVLFQTAGDNAKRDLAMHFAVHLPRDAKEIQGCLAALGIGALDFSHLPSLPAQARDEKPVASCKSLLLHGRMHLESRQYSKALDCFRKAQELEPDNIQALTAIVNLNLLLAEDMEGDLPRISPLVLEAIKAKRAAEKLEPNDIRVRESQAHIHVFERNYDAAEAILKEVVGLEPHRLFSLNLLAETHRAKGDLLKRAGDADGARAEYEKSLGVCVQAIRCAEKPADIAEGFMGVASTYRRLDESRKANYAQALTDFQWTPIAMAAKNAAFFALGLMGRTNSVEKTPVAATVSESDRIQVLQRSKLARANRLLEHNQWPYGGTENSQKALVLFQEVLEQDPRCMPALTGAARALVSMAANEQDPREILLTNAQYYVESAVQIDPEDGLLLEARAYLAAGRWQHREALRWIWASLAKNPKGLPSLTLLVKMLARFGLEENAVDVCAVILDLVVEPEEVGKYYQMLSILYDRLRARAPDAAVSDLLGRKSRMAGVIAQLPPGSGLENGACMFSLGLKDRSDFDGVGKNVDEKIKYVIESIEKDIEIPVLLEAIPADRDSRIARAAICFGRGSRLMAERESIFAAIYFEKAAELFPEMPVALWGGLARCHMDTILNSVKMGLPEDVIDITVLKAHDAIRRGLEESPRDMALAHLQIQLLVFEGKFDQAADAANRLLAVNPGNTETLMALLRICIEKKQTDQALKIAGLLIETASKDQAAWSALMMDIAHIYRASGRANREELLQKAMELSQLSPPGTPRELSDTIDLLGLSGNLQDASL